MDPSKHDEALVDTASPVDETGKLHSAGSIPGYGAHESTTNGPEPAEEVIEESGTGWFAYLKTRNFYIVLVLGFVEPSQASFLEAVIDKLVL